MSEMSMLDKIQETAAFLKAKMHTQPETAIILGTSFYSRRPQRKIDIRKTG